MPVQCLYCGAQVADEAHHCSACGAPSHFQRSGERPRARRRFLLFFVLLVIFCAALILWLPRAASGSSLSFPQPGATGSAGCWSAGS